MPQPTPEEWWASLDEADRAAFKAAWRDRRLTEELYQKLSDANVPVQQWVTGETNISYYLPMAFQQFLDARVAEDDARGSS
jgi:hypothetical protein